MSQKIRSSANNLYDHYCYPEKLFEYKNGFTYTQGIYDIANDEDCFIVLDVLCYQRKNFDVEIWEFSRSHNKNFTLIGKSKQGFTFTEIFNLESDFFFDDLILLKKGNLLCLPIEEKFYNS